MDRINPLFYYKLGQTVGRLRDRPRNDTDRMDLIFELWDIQGALRDLINSPVYSPKIAGKSARLVLETFEACFDQYYREKSETGEKTFRWPKADDPKIPVWEIQRLIQSIQNFELLFSEELTEARTYKVKQVGIYATDLLVDDAGLAFAASARASIPDKAKEEWAAAGKCLAFGLMSATGFHVARSVEAMLETYYVHFCGHPKKDKMFWGDYIAALKAWKPSDKKSSPSRVALALEQMKDDYRNPLMHPTVTLNEEEARILFSSAEALIGLMASGMASNPRHVSLPPKNKRQRKQKTGSPA